MTRQQRSSGSSGLAEPSRRKATQRERLLAGMVAIGNEVGYASASVSRVIEHAGVSRPTFYDYFGDRDACFLAALEDVHRRLAAGVRARVKAARPERALHSAIEALIEFAVVDPAAARFLTSEAMAAGASALEARDRGLAEIARIIERAQGRAPASTPVPDLSAQIVMGGVCRLLGARLRRGEPGLSRLLDDLLLWIESYARPAPKLRWRSLGKGSAPARSPFVPAEPLRAPAMLGPGRPRLAAEEVAENQRLRVLFATATLAAADGYAACTVADILRLAGVDGRTLYGHFAGKQEAFMAVHELGVQQVLWVTGEAFFSGGSWPQRIWEGARAFAQFLELNPLIARVGFVEAYAVGGAAVQRVEDSHFAFAMFLQEGYQYAPESGLSRLALEAIVTSIFEMVYLEARRRRPPRTPELIAQVCFLCLAPFLGVEAAGAFLERQP